MSAQTQKLAWLQALRGVAALMVVMVHNRSVLLDTEAGKAVANHVLLPMAMGVDLFFIISGFLMVLTTRDFDGSRAYAGKFLVKRLARIWPLFAVMSLMALMVEHGFRGFRELSVAFPYLEGLAFIPHNPAASDIYFQMAVGVAWTLCFECYFYLLFGASMLFGRWRYWAMAAWFALMLVAVPIYRGGYNFGVATQPLVAWSRYANLAVNPIVWDFVFGMFAGWLYVSQVTIKSRIAIYSFAIVSTAALLVTWHRLGMVNFFGPSGWGAPLAILFACMVMLAKIGAIKVPAQLVWLGEISYSLYLVHVYVFEIMQRVVMHLSLTPEVAKWTLFIGRPMVAVFCAWVTFVCIERPASEWMRKQLLGIHAFGYSLLLRQRPGAALE